MNSKHHDRYQVKITGIIVILLSPLILPDYFQNINIIENLTTLIIGIMFLYLFVISIIKRDINPFVIVSCLYLIWRSYSSYYYSNGVLDLVNSFRIATIILLINLIIKSFPRATLKALSIVFGLYIIINFITFFTFPEGLYLTSKYNKAWLFGIENQFGLFLIPGITLVILYSWYKYNKFSKLALVIILITILTVLKAWSATAIVSIFFVIISVIINLRKKIKPIYSFSILTIIYTLLWTFIVRFNSLDSFQTIIVDILNKDLTLSFRTNIWTKAFETIPYSLWYGFGINTEILAGVITYFAAHNMILQIILDSGLIGLFLFLGCIVISGIKLQKYKNNKLSVILLIGIFAILIGGLTEAYRINYLFLLLALSYNIDYISKSFEMKNQQSNKLY